MEPAWGPPGSCRPQMGPMSAPWTLLSHEPCHGNFHSASLLNIETMQVVEIHALGRQKKKTVIGPLYKANIMTTGGYSSNDTDVVLHEYPVLSPGGLIFSPERHCAFYTYYIIKWVSYSPAFQRDFTLIKSVGAGYTLIKSIGAGYSVAINYPINQ